ncbi:MAG: sigma factor-like helix-turn-helix DNA-binding protein [Dehalococcoidia bacterium]|jgi:DNA-directed RNA polymerase sigma subunit (sigma70/sigma32)
MTDIERWIKKEDSKTRIRMLLTLLKEVVPKDRDRAIVRHRMTGELNYRELGVIFDLSRERIKQIEYSFRKNIIRIPNYKKMMQLLLQGEW